LVEGYTRQIFGVIPSDLSKFLLMLFDAVAYWNFESLSTDFYDKAYRHVLFGPRIAFKDIIFQCTLCPSGWSHRDCVQFYIEFDKEQMRGQLPENVQSVTAYLVIYCHQIQYEYRTPKIFHNIDSAQGWPAYRIGDLRVKDWESLNFGCYIELLRVDFRDGTFTGADSADSLTEESMSMSTEEPMEESDYYDEFLDKTHVVSPRSTCRWVVDGELLARMKKSKHSQGFYSPNFDAGSWCLSCSPSGIKKQYDGKFCVALKMLKMPYRSNSIKVKHTIKVRSDDGEFRLDVEEEKVFDYRHKASRFSKDGDEVGSFMKAKSLEFMVTVEVVEDDEEEDDDDDDDDMDEDERSSSSSLSSSSMELDL